MRRQLRLLLMPILAISTAASLRAQNVMNGPSIQSPFVKAPYNPRPFQNSLVSPSAPIRFLFSEAGGDFLRRFPNQQMKELLESLGEDVSGIPDERAPEVVSGILPLQTVACNNTTGNPFNLEPRPNAKPQDEESIDLILNRVSAGVDLIVQGANDFRQLGGLTGYYVHRANSDCSVQFEGALPPVNNPLSPGNKLYGGGDPVVAADATRDAFFMADLRYNASATGVGVLRSSVATLINPTFCPNGTQSRSAEATCWPTGTMVNALPGTMKVNFNDKPHLAVDERMSGVGAGNVYITATLFNMSVTPNTSQIWIVACANDLSSCSPAAYISGSDSDTQFSHVSVRPDGIVTITYANSVQLNPPNPFPQRFDIKYVSCSPANAPAAPPLCSAPSLVTSEMQPLPFGGGLEAEEFRIATYPKHDHQMESNGSIQTYIVWDRCKVPLLNGKICVDADVVMVASNDGGSTWSGVTAVNSNVKDQFFPWIRTDRSTNTVNISYYSSENDFFQHRVQVFVNQIAPGKSLPNPVSSPTVLTLTADDPDGDPSVRGTFFGDYIGLAAGGTGVSGQSRAYAAFTYNTSRGVYNGVVAPEQNNHLSRVDY